MSQQFDKSVTSFPVKEDCVYLANCGVAPMYAGAAAAIDAFSTLRTKRGIGVFPAVGDVLGRLREATGKLLKADPANVSFTKNTAEGLSMIAGGYPFEDGDEIISFEHEYPSNHYPWLIQERRGVKLRLMPNRLDDTSDPTRAWHMEDLEALITPRTRIIAISHVQFTNGYAADLPALGALCNEHGIDLVVDTAQSLGALPVYPEQYGIAALAGSGWKWLLGPVGCGLLYTSPALRAKLAPVNVGADIVVQGEDYLDHTWQPHTDGRMFEYSTAQVSYASALLRCIEDLFLPHEPEAVRAEVFRLQDVFLDTLDDDRYERVTFDDANRAGTIAFRCKQGPDAVVRGLRRERIVVSARGGLLRIAPHFYNDDDELRRAAEAMNKLPVE